MPPQYSIATRTSATLRRIFALLFVQYSADSVPKQRTPVMIQLQHSGSRLQCRPASSRRETVPSLRLRFQIERPGEILQ